MHHFVLVSTDHNFSRRRYFRSFHRSLPVGEPTRNACSLKYTVRLEFPIRFRITFLTHLFKSGAICSNISMLNDGLSVMCGTSSRDSSSPGDSCRGLTGWACPLCRIIRRAMPEPSVARAITDTAMLMAKTLTKEHRKTVIWRVMFIPSIPGACNLYRWLSFVNDFVRQFCCRHLWIEFCST